MFRNKLKNRGDFNGKVVLITGGSRGIGLATAQAFMEQGGQVIICALHRETLQAAESQLSLLGEITSYQVDVRDSQEIEHVFQKIVYRFEHIDILVNNAGVLWTGDYSREPYHSIDAVIDTNIKGVLYMTRAILPHMIARRSGVIINISSGAGLIGYGQLVAYSTSKYAVVGFTESLDQEVREYGIRVYALCPGKVATDMQVQYSGAKIGKPPDKIAEKILQFARFTGSIPTDAVHTI